MNLKAALSLGALGLTLVACSKASAPSPLPSASVAPVASASAQPPSRSEKPTHEEMFQGDDPQAQPLVLGPVEAGGSTEQRRQRLKELLSGQTQAERLTLVATEPDMPHDSQLFRRLTTELEPSSGGEIGGFEADPFTIELGQAQLLSGKIDSERLWRATVSMRASIRFCYRRALEDKASGAKPNARLVAVFDVDADGRPSRISAEGAAPKALFGCVKQRGMGMGLDPPPGGPLRFRLPVASKSAR